MSTEINDIEKTVVVFNSKCGSGDIDKKHLQSLFGECWSFPVGILGINETNPDKLVDTNVIIWGGDGTNCGVAENFRKIGGAGWCLLMDGGTLGDTSKATGVGRNTFETPRHYIKRIGDMYINNNLEVKEFSPGTIINGGEKNFLWTAGLGIAEQVLGRVEIARSKKLIKFARLVHGLWGITNDLRNAEEIDVSLPNDRNFISVADVNYIQHFSRFGSMNLPFSGDNQLWIIHKPESKREAFGIAMHLAWDAIRLKMKLNPTTGAVKISRLIKGQEIIIRGDGIRRLQKDSELIDIEPTKIITISTNEEEKNPYRLLVKK